MNGVACSPDYLRQLNEGSRSAGQMCIEFAMADTLTPELRSARMALIKSKGSSAEMLVRRLVHGLGFRYRLHVKDLPGKPDLVFGPRKKVIFVHGCFWHRHKKPSCRLARLPKTRQDFWLPKLDGNRERDLHNKRLLRRMGWSVLEIWECDLQNRQTLANKILYFLKDEVA